MARKLLAALALGKITAHAGSQGRSFDQPRHLLIVEPLGADSLALPGNAPEQRAMANTR